ncbi:inosine/xanthosine triphosphatase [Pontibacter sp. E15-1]|uniref:inosine/xanthosine triphosphatase n=1 Tax=Pontibacter sp. E15-1 TaxID=2919918 RepID=UPI001F4FC7B6|nr:inosine/xanthosine triphosphatase [Pontibacter sp. E15-1]MCJ8167412.1 inosine/xanthosine triphosphatase [Pontibacter sp. E15-1]
MQPKKVVVASLNPVKVQAALEGIRRMFPEESFEAIPRSVPSNVAEQPMTDTETLTGAVNRVNNAFDTHPDADFWVGIEGGVAGMDGELTAFAWVVVRSGGLVGKARSGTFFLPRAVADLVAQGIELGTADDMVFNRNNSKQAGGAIGILTANALDRKQLYAQAVMLALVPFKNEPLYAGTESAAQR